MRKLYLLLIIITIGFSCENKTEIPPDLNPTYSNFENAWEVRNLYGKVKKLKLYKSTFQDTKTPEKSILNLAVSFTDFGAIKRIEQYDNFGELIQKDILEYNNEEFLTKQVSTNKRAKSNYVMIVENDTVNKTKTTVATINDSIEQQIIVFYNDKDYVVKQIAIEKNDTTITHHKYKFDENDNLLSEIQYEKDENDPIITNQYKYNQKGKIVWSSSKTPWMEHITETEWKKERIIKQTEYTIPEDSKEHLDIIIEYDKLFNPINLKIYENSELNRELKHNYEFDEKGNWIKRTVSMKEHFANSDKFIPIYIETRKIKYYE